MNTQQIFGKRLETLLIEKDISQGDFANAMNCSRQSINFYILGKRNPDIALASQMADYLGVSCDYLVGRSDIRLDKTASLSVGQIGIADATVKLFMDLQLLATGKADAYKVGIGREKDIATFAMAQSQKTLKLLNDIVSHEQFRILLQYVKRYRDICHGEDTMALLQDFMMQFESPITGNIYGGTDENMEMMKEFCLHIISKYFDEIVKDIAKK